MEKFVAEFCPHQEYEDAPTVRVAGEDTGRTMLGDIRVELTPDDRESRRGMLATAEVALRDRGWFVPDGEAWEDGDDSYFVTVEHQPLEPFTIDWSEHDGLSPREQYEQAGDIIDKAKAAAAARRARIAHDLKQEHGAQKASSILGISKQRVYKLSDRYRDAQPVICDNFPGRSITSYDLLDEIQDAYGLDRRQAHEEIYATLEQLVDVDGEEQVIIARRPQRPELLKSNPNDVDVRYWLVIRAETVDEIRAAFAAQYGDS